jgi:hypothetical protein
MYAGWNLVLTLIVSLLSCHATAFWPFSTLVFAESGGVNNGYADPAAKRIAIIGTLSDDFLYGHSEHHDSNLG